MSEIAAPASAAPVVAANSNTEVANDNVETQVKTAAPKAPPPERTFKIVIDGKARELTETQAITELQKSAAADKRLQQATEKQKQVDALLRDFESDPEAALAKLGKDPAKVIADHLAKKARLELMTPEQREAEALRRERDEYKQRAEAHEKAKKDAVEAEAFERHVAAIQRQFIAAADKYGLEGTPDQLEELADVAHQMLVDFNYAPTIDQVFQEYLFKEQEHIERRDRKIFSRLQGKKLLDYLGKDGLAKVLAAKSAADAESLKLIPAPQKTTKSVQVKAHVREAKGHIRENDFDRKFGL